ncbi:META domain-containing protein [Alishewanella sp. HL-SH06]|uniref:META domain-containing protein n=1 Tax=Alishewanella sp. HL-SH06 TaxID=3461144 RepID=UPI004041C5E4
MKKLVVVTALLLSACSQLPDIGADKPTTLSAEKQPVLAVPIPAPVTDASEVANNDTTESLATDFEHIFIDTDMTFEGVLPCADCSGIAYHINLYRDGRFEARQEYLGRGQVQLISGSWLLEKRTLHLINQQSTLPVFHFRSNQHLVMTDLAGKPILSSEAYQLSRYASLKKLDQRQPLLGMYQLKNNVATFITCQNGDTLPVANTQNHLPMMRLYQQDTRLNNKPVIATLVGRKSADQHGIDTLYIDKFEQFWPNATCPDQFAQKQLQGIVWRAEKVANRYIPHQLNVRLIFEKDRLYGFSGCNNFNASYEQQANTLSVQPLASTRKFCAEASNIEQQFTEKLQQVDRAEVNADKLQLFYNNQVILELVPAVN